MCVNSAIAIDGNHTMRLPALTELTPRQQEISDAHREPSAAPPAGRS